MGLGGALAGHLNPRYTQTQCHNGEPFARWYHFHIIPLGLGYFSVMLVFLHPRSKTQFLVVLGLSQYPVKRQFFFKGLKAALPGKESCLYGLLYCFHGMCVKSCESLSGI